MFLHIVKEILERTKSLGSNTKELENCRLGWMEFGHYRRKKVQHLQFTLPSTGLNGIQSVTLNELEFFIPKY
jgi:hypothetical protein